MLKHYIGVKEIDAKQMNRGEYNNYRGWNIPEDENPEDEGYLVVYPDGYQSWSPKKAFEDAYREATKGCMTFGLAIEALKKGKKVARKGWNGKNMYLYHVPEDHYMCRTKIAKEEFGPSVQCGAYIAMKPANGPIVIGWLASQTDMLEEDWVIVK